MCGTVSVTGSACSPGRGAGWNAIRRCATRCSGPTTCSTTTNGRCWAAVRCSPTASTWPPPRTSAATGWTSTRCWTCWIRWCASRWSPPSMSVGHARYGMLETIRQFAEDQLAATGTIDEVRDRHARYFAEQAVAHWDDLGRAPPTRRRRLGGCRVRQPARRVPLGRRPRRPRHRRGHRRAHHACWPWSCSGSSRSGGPKRSSRRPPRPICVNSRGSTPPPVSAR